MAMTPTERSNRRHARERGEDVPKVRPGPKKGYKQSADHIEKRKRFGADHHAWKGDGVTEKSGRSRALRAFPVSEPCEDCGSRRTERHHRDGDTANNAPENIAWVCRRCHMKRDGRLDEFVRLAKRNQPKAVIARWRQSVL